MRPTKRELMKTIDDLWEYREAGRSFFDLSATGCMKITPDHHKDCLVSLRRLISSITGSGTKDEIRQYARTCLKFMMLKRPEESEIDDILGEKQ